MYIDTSKKSKGLGDSIEKFTTYTGIKTITEAITKLAGAKGCGCDERKEYLNELFPYETTVRRVEVIKEFNWEGGKYEVGSIYSVSKNDPLYNVIIQFTRDKFLKEL